MPDPTRSLDERTPDELGEYLDDHLLMALDAAERLHPDRQDAEDYVRDRLVALSDTFATAPEVRAEERRRRMDRLRAMLQSAD